MINLIKKPWICLPESMEIPTEHCEVVCVFNGAEFNAYFSPNNGGEFHRWLESFGMMVEIFPTEVIRILPEGTIG